MDEKEDVSQNELCRDEESQSLTVYIETFEDQNSKREDIEIILDDEESAKSIFDSFLRPSIQWKFMSRRMKVYIVMKAILLVLWDLVAINTLTWNLQNQEGIQFSHG